MPIVTLEVEIPKEGNESNELFTCTPNGQLSDSLRALLVGVLTSLNVKDYSLRIIEYPWATVLAEMVSDYCSEHNVNLTDKEMEMVSSSIRSEDTVSDTIQREIELTIEQFYPDRFNAEEKICGFCGQTIDDDQPWEHVENYPWCSYCYENHRPDLSKCEITDCQPKTTE